MSNLHRADSSFQNIRLILSMLLAVSLLVVIGCGDPQMNSIEVGPDRGAVQSNISNPLGSESPEDDRAVGAGIKNATFGGKENAPDPTSTGATDGN